MRHTISRLDGPLPMHAQPPLDRTAARSMKVAALVAAVATGTDEKPEHARARQACSGSIHCFSARTIRVSLAGDGDKTFCRDSV